ENTTLVTGAPLENLGAALTRNPSLVAGRWVAQGGFAGEGVMPAERQLEKFRGRRTCATWNLGGDHKSALAAIAHAGIREKRFVSKNVCHGIAWDRAWHERVRPHAEKSESLRRIFAMMDHYLTKHPDGKLLHDPFAA